MFEVTVMDLSPNREESTEASDESSDTGRTITVDLDVVTELTSLALDLDTVVEELFEGRAIKDTVRGRAGVVNDELVLGSSRLSGGGLGLHYGKKKRKPSVSLLRR